MSDKCKDNKIFDLTMNNICGFNHMYTSQAPRTEEPTMHLIFLRLCGMLFMLARDYASAYLATA